MTTATPDAPSRDDLSKELIDLQQSMLPSLIVALPILGWAWFGLVLMQGWRLGLNLAPLVILLVGAYASYRLYARHFRLTCWVLLSALTLAQVVIVAEHPSSLASVGGVVVAVLASSLIGMPGAVLVTAGNWLANVLVWHTVSGAPVGTGTPIQSGVLYGLTLGAAWLARRPLNSSVECALAGWVRARDALLEVRERRGELYRVVRALEEATYRMERVNNELVVARREAELARALKARFAATVSHELRGPLNLILGFSSMMVLSPERYPAPLPDCYVEDVDAIYRNSMHLAALVDDVLDLSQIEVERLPLVKDRVELHRDVVDQVVEIVQPFAERKGLRLQAEIRAGLPWVLADAVRLRQVLLNLLSNAIRFTERGIVTIRATREDERLRVTVQDTGPGIASEDIPRLFQEFHQLQLTETRAERGSGLGLSICKHLVELHGGEIWVESRKGAGTAFHFTVPLPGIGPVVAKARHTLDAPVAKEGPKTCLVVHHDPTIVRLFARYLEGYRVVGAPREGVANLCEQLHPHAVVVPLESAPFVEAALQGTALDVPIISCVMPDVQRAQGHSGVLGYLIKPIAPEMLWAVMNEVRPRGQLRILLVDDDPDAVRLLERMLTALPHPYTIMKAFDGAHALEVMEQNVPDVALIDLVMPGMDGQQLLERMRADARLQNIPVVIVSARDTSEDHLSLSTPITVRTQRPIEFARGSHCLRTVLDALTPRHPAGSVSH